MLGDDPSGLLLLPLHSWYHADFLSAESETAALCWEWTYRRDHGLAQMSELDDPAVCPTAETQQVPPRESPRETPRESVAT